MKKLILICIPKFTKFIHSAILRVSYPYSCIHEKLFSFNKELKKNSDCICPQRLSLLQAQDPEFARFVASYGNIRKGTEHSFLNLKMPRKKESGVLTVRDRLKRPDKQLYVPRALRKTISEGIPEKTEKGSKISENNDKIADVLNKSSCKSIVNNSLPEKHKYSGEKIQKLSKSTSTDVSFKIEQNNLSPQTNFILQTKQQLDLSAEKNEPGKFYSLGFFSQIQMKDDDQCADVERDDIPVISIDKDIAKFSDKTFSVDLTGRVKSESEFTSEYSFQNSSEDLINKVESESELINRESFQNSSEDLISRMTSKSELSSEESVLNINTLHVEDNVVKTIASSENDEESWEAMFNDDGDCLDPKFVKELCHITGRIDLTSAKSDYSEYQPQSRNSSEEFENIVELYGFPVEFKTQDLTSAFSTFQEASYNIKWVDDCHALAIFSSPVIANQALHLTHPFIKVRPLSEGIKESKEKARLCSRMLEVRKPRPATSAVLARRLVSGALGLKADISKEQREIERNKLREAKEKKRLKAKQRQDIWNGIVS